MENQTQITRIEKLGKSQAFVPHGKLRVAAYVRVSSGKYAALDSSENQADSYTKLIKDNPKWDFAGIYEDKGISGTKECRPAFQRMLADCRDNKIDMIITKSFSRFARNTVVLLKTLRELKELNIDVFFEKDNIHSLDGKGEFLISVLAAYAQAESFSASENQKWRIRKMFENGCPTGGRMMGYRFDKGSLKVIPREAKVVRQVFNDYLSGMGLEKIARKLNSLNISTMNGGIWHQTSVRAMLTNEKYTGELILQKTYCKDFISKKMVKNNGERTKYLVENSHEAIIDKNVFNSVSSIMQERSRKLRPKQPRTRRYIFTSLITCGRCNKHFRRRYNHYGTKYEKPVWLCATFVKRGKDFCNGHQIPESVLISKTKEVLGAEELNEVTVSGLRSIYIPKPGCLVYIFQDGREREVSWQNSSRRESWTPVMRQKAREQALNGYRMWHCKNG